MRVRTTLSKIRDFRLFPMILALLLVVRVAAYPAIQCQHAIAEATTEVAQVATGIPYEPGDLCGLPQAAKDDTAQHELNTLCPFFAAPVMVPDSFVALEAQYQTYSRTRPSLDATLVASDETPAGYNPRAPPALV